MSILSSFTHSHALPKREEESQKNVEETKKKILWRTLVSIQLMAHIDFHRRKQDYMEFNGDSQLTGYQYS